MQNWDQHLKSLTDRDLANMANDYRWLDEDARPEHERAEFRRRREAICAECDRRGTPDLAAACRRPAMGGGSGR